MNYRIKFFANKKRLEPWCGDCLYNVSKESAEFFYSEGDEYNGIYLEDSLTASQIKAASEIMGKALYNYYFA